MELDLINIGEIQLNSTQYNNSSAGVLGKATIVYEGKNYIVKSGMFSKPIFTTLEPVIECICSELIQLFKINCANYDLVKCTVQGNELWKTQESIVCISENFLGENEIIIHADNILNTKNTRTSYKHLTEVFKNNVIDINNMLIIDYIINNTDRHHKNFAMIYNSENNSLKFAPLYDHGFSLGQEMDIDYLESESDDFSEVYTESDYSKCCGVSNSSQIANIDYHSVKIDVDIEEIYKIIDKYKCYLKPATYEFMKYIIKRRLSYVKRVFTKGEGCYTRNNNI
ncbi:HipA domain-containing protein [Clostridium gasigenes]|uniref:HipA domain-containing protein n=1 Tax=Clostridium gasigenes TaxID=94869 RepID=UPI001C0D80E1|nr:HipA domain-containing protein [Clostridium gasigenes]MBU3089440.1 HipA domain-containing protein [Clostridium gasigenes]